MLNSFTRASLPAREIKRAPLALQRIDAQGLFEGYASLFGVADLGRDIVLPGAFKKTLAKRDARQIKMLWQHKASEPIGTWQDVSEDSRGLHVIGRLNLDVARAREVYSLMKEGAVDGLSIGFRAARSLRDKSSGLRRLAEIDLWEISLVTFPMLPQARINAVKSHRGGHAALALRARWSAAADAFATEIASH